VAAAALLIAAHAWRRCPLAPPPALLLEGSGLWSVPERGLAGLGVGFRTRYTAFWVRLSLVGPGRGLDILLLADQLDSESWRALQARLRRGNTAIGRERPDVLR
jgi:hypothetical protein